MNHHSECFLDNENNITHLLNNFIVFSRQYKNEEKLGNTFLELYYNKMKHVSFIYF